MDDSENVCESQVRRMRVRGHWTGVAGSSNVAISPEVSYVSIVSSLAVVTILFYYYDKKIVGLIIKYNIMCSILRGPSVHHIRPERNANSLTFF